MLAAWEEVVDRALRGAAYSDDVVDAGASSPPPRSRSRVAAIIFALLAVSPLAMETMII
jgi:hypothetical protein